MEDETLVGFTSHKHGYPPVMELKATETVIEQANLLATDYSSYD
jgi:hypothetical protein